MTSTSTSTSTLPSPSPSSSPPSHSPSIPSSASTSTSTSTSLLFPHHLTMAQILDEMKVATTNLQHIDQQLDGMMEMRHQLEKQVDASFEPSRSISHPSLSSTSPGMSHLSTTAHHLHHNIHKSSLSAQALSSKVRDLDLAQKRLKEALARVESVLDLKTTIANVDTHIAAHQYAEAAQHTHRALYRQQPVTNDVSYEVLLGLERTLREIIIRECEDAQQHDDLQRCMKFSKLLPLVGLTYQGLTTYCNIVRQVTVNELTRHGLTLTSLPENAIIPYPSHLASLLGGITSSIKQHARTVATSFGTGSHLRLIQSMQLECDAQVTSLLRKFISDKKIVKLVNQVKSAGNKPSSARQPKSARPDKPELDLPSLDALLEEISHITQQCEVFDYGMRTAAKQARQALHHAVEQEEIKEKQKKDGYGESKEPEPTSSDQRIVHMRTLYTSLSSDAISADFPHITRVNEVVQEMIGYYIALEEYYMIQNVQKAIAIDQHVASSPIPSIEDEDKKLDETGTSTSTTVRSLQNYVSAAVTSVPGSTTLPGVSMDVTSLVPKFKDNLTSTMVDDIFYVLKRCTERAFSTTSPNAACAIVNHLNAVLSRDYRQVLESILTEYSRSYGTISATGQLVNMFQTATQLAKKQNDDARLIVTMNNIDVSTSNMSTLKSNLDAEFEHVFAHSESRTMIRHCLDDLAETSRSFKALTKTGLQLIITALTPRLRPILDSLNTCEYELKEADYTDREIHDPFIQNIIEALEREVVPFRGCLSESNFSSLVNEIITLIVTRWEQAIMKLKFTFWGGLQLDKDVRKLSAFLSGLAAVSVRDKMARLVQIASILQLERCSEILDYWGDNSSSQVWRLYEGEVRKVLALRTDFAIREINALKLA